MLKVLILIMTAVAICDVRSTHCSEPDARLNQKVPSLRDYAMKYVKNPVKRELQETPLRNHLEEEMNDLEETLDAILRESDDETE